MKQIKGLIVLLLMVFAYVGATPAFAQDDIMSNLRANLRAKIDCVNKENNELDTKIQDINNKITDFKNREEIIATRDALSNKIDSLSTVSSILDSDIKDYGNKKQTIKSHIAKLEQTDPEWQQEQVQKVLNITKRPFSKLTGVVLDKEIINNFATKEQKNRIEKFEYYWGLYNRAKKDIAKLDDESMNKLFDIFDNKNKYIGNGSLTEEQASELIDCL